MVKLNDIAKELKLAAVTVSAVLNDRYKALGISEATAERIRKTAKEMGYQENMLSKAMRTGRTYSLGCILSERRPTQWIAEVQMGALAAARDRDYFIRIEEISEMAGGAAEALKRLVGQQVEGIIGVNIERVPRGFDEFRQATDRYGIPLLGINCAPEFSSVQVAPNHEGGSRDAVEFLVRLGHERIGFIGGPSHSVAAQERKLGFIQSLSEFGLSYDPELIIDSGWHLDDAEESAGILLRDRALAPTAIVAANDVLGATTQRVARARGFRLPEDLSVVAFSNTVATACCDPQLTVIDMHFDHVGMKAAELLIGHIESKGKGDLEIPPRSVTPVELVRRESTSRPGKPGRKTYTA